jgi:hypothetical protein
VVVFFLILPAQGSFGPGLACFPDGGLGGFGSVSTESFLFVEIHKMAYGWDARHNAAAATPPSPSPSRDIS